MKKWLLQLLFGFSFGVSAQIGAKEFVDCQDADQFESLKGSQCTTVAVPLNHQQPMLGDIELFVRKFPATARPKGSLWLVAGGPGESGAVFYSMLPVFQQAFPDLDIFVPDHRGTGASTPICPGEQMASEGGIALVGAEWGECFSYMYANVATVQAFSITNAAYDLTLLMNRFSGSGTRYLYGVSYGTQLALRVAQLPQHQLDGLILDSIVPLQDDVDYDLSQRSQVVNDVGGQLLARCNDKTLCDGVSAEQLSVQLRQLLGTSNSLKGYSDALPDGSLSDTLAIMLDVPPVRAQLPQLIIALAKGDAQPLVDVVNQTNAFYAKLNPGYHNFGSSIPLVQVISASENNLRPQVSKSQLEAEAAPLLFTSPLPQLLAGNSMPTYDKDPFFAALPSSLPNTLIIHGNLDPKTHVVGSKKHAQALAALGPVTWVEVADGVHFNALNAASCFISHSKAFVAGKSDTGEVLCVAEEARLKL